MTIHEAHCSSPRDGVKLAGERHRFARKTVMNIAVRRSFDKKIRFEGNFGEWLRSPSSCHPRSNVDN
jgi:hypothetical protein